jgi:hypothetical protein
MSISYRQIIYVQQGGAPERKQRKVELSVSFLSTISTNKTLRICVRGNDAASFMIRRGPRWGWSREQQKGEIEFLQVRTPLF